MTYVKHFVRMMVKCALGAHPRESNSLKASLLFYRIRGGGQWAHHNKTAYQVFGLSEEKMSIGMRSESVECRFLLRSVDVAIGISRPWANVMHQEPRRARDFADSSPGDTPATRFIKLDDAAEGSSCEAEEVLAR